MELRGYCDPLISRGFDDAGRKPNAHGYYYCLFNSLSGDVFYF